VVEPNIYERVPLTGPRARCVPTRFFVKMCDRYYGSFTLEQARLLRDQLNDERAHAAIGHGLRKPPQRTFGRSTIGRRSRLVMGAAE
jgi:hypothetical protein